jgi:hypothetical protein
MPRRRKIRHTSPLTVGYAMTPRKLKNQTQTGYGQAAAYLFGTGDPKYKIGAFYIEFENGSEEESSVVPPEGFSADEGIEYYTELGSPRDYIRVPIVIPPVIDTDPNFASSFYNRITLYAETTATEGENGLAFTAGAASKIFGLAIVATPDWDDPSQDLIIGRRYYGEDDQFMRPTQGGVRVSWAQSFPI